MTSGGHGFPAAHRLKKRQEFLHCKKMGRKVHTSHFLIFIERHSTTIPARLGVTVSRKVGNAVVRNRLKRLVREFFRIHYQQFEGCCSYSIIAKRQAANIDYRLVCRELSILTAGRAESS